MKFCIHYDTRWGENLFLRAGGKSYPMTFVADGRWEVELPAKALREGDEYYYEVMEGDLHTRHEWHPHRLAQKPSKSLVVNDRWSDVTGWRGAGTAIPVFALRTKKDFGVGEFQDLYALVDWAAATGQCFIQLLPINDTTMSHTWQDSYPYNANSSFALHPMFLHLPGIGISEDEAYCRQRDALNAQPFVDYEAVNAAKWDYIRLAFRKTFPGLSARPDYQSFVSENRHWLLPYAAFCVLRDANGTADFHRWKEYAQYKPKKVAAFVAAHQEECDLHCFVQYHLHRQLRGVREYAHSKGVFLKGDLPIGVSRTSADAWVSPHLFNLDSQAGAPPDYFSRDGQNWDFPTYNWDEMAKDGYAWWKARLGRMSQYFDAFRIDHILGFFRIWEIPVPFKSGLEGHFNPALPYSLQELKDRGLAFPNALQQLFLEDPRRKGWWHPRIGAKQSQAYRDLYGHSLHEFDALYDDFFYRRHNEFWRGKATERLSALLGATPMLSCGEDLGMIAPCVPEVMARLNILSLEMPRMPKTPGEEYADPASFPYFSVCTTSSHDMSPLRMWWEEYYEPTAHYYYNVLHRDGNVPPELPSDCARQILEQALSAPSMLCILPLQDWLATSDSLRHPDVKAERINDPANSKHYWRYRMHIPIEKMAADVFFCQTVRELVTLSGRKIHTED